MGNGAEKDLTYYDLHFHIKKYTRSEREIFYVKIIFMQAAPFIILPDYTREERQNIVVKISDRIYTRNKVRDAYNRLFGIQLPHIQIERLIRMNSRALIDTYNMRLFRIISSNPVADFYTEDEYIEDYQLRYAPFWDDGKLIARWQKYTKNPNPHHIVPQSRG